MSSILQSFWNGYVGAEIYPIEKPKEKGEITIKIRKMQIQEFQKNFDDQRREIKKSLDSRRKTK